jgi:hypothetical protein
MLYTLAKHAWISLFVVVSEGQSISFLAENVKHMQGGKLRVVFHFLEVWERKKSKYYQKP